jgi:hypothetical protein
MSLNAWWFQSYIYIGQWTPTFDIAVGDETNKYPAVLLHGTIQEYIPWKYNLTLPSIDLKGIEASIDLRGHVSLHGIRGLEVRYTKKV